MVRPPLAAFPASGVPVGAAPEAEREGLRGVAMLPISLDAYLGPKVQLQLVRIYLLTGRLDPAFEPVRGHPRFLQLIGFGPPVRAARS